MKHMEDFYLKKMMEAIELGDEEMMNRLNRKYTRLVRQGEAKSLAKLLLVIVIFTISSPLIHWWLIGWRYNL